MTTENKRSSRKKSSKKSSQIVEGIRVRVIEEGHKEQGNIGTVLGLREREAHVKFVGRSGVLIFIDSLEEIK